MSEASVHQHWSSRFAFIMATVGAAVGLGNFWRFPYEAGQNGGGAFVIVYIGVILLIAIPLVMTELVIGRRGQLSAVGSAAAVGREQGGTALWGIIGWIGMIASFLILTFYSMIAGWVMEYIRIAAFSPASFSGGVDAVEALFAGEDGLLNNVGLVTFWHAVFMVLTCAIVARGLHSGIEWAANILMPAFFVMLIFMVGYAYFEGDFAGGWNYLFVPDWSQISVGTVMDAIGQAFFSVSVATAILITYGAYLEQDSNLPRSTFIISFADTAVALLAGLAIFPLVFAYGGDPNGGPGLLFVTLPLAFAELPMGNIFAVVFFTLAFFAALTSSIAILEIVISWAEEQGMSRPRATMAFGGLAWLIGLGSILSFAGVDGFQIKNDALLPGLEDRNFFGIIDFVTANLMLPLGGLLIGLFGGLVISKDVLRDDLRLPEGLIMPWRIFVGGLIPIAIFGVLVINTADKGFGVDVLAEWFGF